VNDRQSWNYLVDRLIEGGILKTGRVIRSMRIVPREEFMPEQLKGYASVDTPFPIGCGQTISAPHMVAMMNEALELEVGQRVLEVGAGSGYHAATIAEVVAPSDGDPKHWGHVYTVEIVQELIDRVKKNLSRIGYADRVTVICADGSKGYPEKAPYDRILVTAASPEIPEPLMEQLKVGGVMAIPVGWHFSQDLMVIRKLPKGEVQRRRLCPVMFVPLRGELGFKE